MRQWIIGLFFSLVVGDIVIRLFLKWLQHWLGKTPPDRDSKRVPAWLTGYVERLFFTILIGADAFAAVPALMLGWLGLKFATNWNHPVQKDPELRPFAFRALLVGLVSMLFALLGGLVCTGKLSLGI